MDVINFMKKSCSYKSKTTSLWQKTKEFKTSFRGNESQKNQKKKVVARTKSRRTVTADLNPHQVTKALLLLTLVSGATLGHTAQQIASSKSRRLNNKQTHYKAKPGYNASNNKTTFANSKDLTANNQSVTCSSHLSKQLQPKTPEITTAKTKAYLNPSYKVTTPKLKTQQSDTANITNNTLDNPNNIVSAPMYLHERYMGSEYPYGYQPPLEKTIEAESALFIEILKPYQNLDPISKQKATLLTIMHRISQVVTYGDDLNSKGELIDFWSTPEDILSRSGQGIDCEDYATLADFYARHAQEKSYLPESANFGIFILPGHALFYYEVNLPNKDTPEFYVIDTKTIGALKSSPSTNKLTTLKEYFYDTKYYSFFASQNDNLSAIASLLSNYNQYYFQPSRIALGETEYSQRNYIETPTVQGWKRKLNDRRQIDESISGDEISTVQYSYIKKHGNYSVPDELRNKKEYSDYTQALEIKKGSFEFCMGKCIIQTLSQHN